MKLSATKTRSICAVILGHALPYQDTRLRSILRLLRQAKRMQVPHTTPVVIAVKNFLISLSLTGTAGSSI